MKVTKGQKLIVKDSRKGTFAGIATADFDTETDEWYSVATREFVCGMSRDWEPGEGIPCRRGLSTVTIEAGEGKRDGD